MKFFHTLILLLPSLSALSQTKKDYAEIISIAIEKNNRNAAFSLYYKFENKGLLEEFKRYSITNSGKFFSFYESHKDSLKRVDKDWMLNNIDIADRFYYYGVAVDNAKAAEELSKTDGKRITRYYNEPFDKTKKKVPALYISLPYVSADGKKAIIHCKCLCGFYCGNEAFLIFEKINRHWEITNPGPAIIY